MTLRILGGQYRGRILHSPKTTATRPTQGVLRQAVFNICQHSISSARFLDLFAGSGAMGLEALSRGAAKAVFVEQNKSASRCIRENIALLQVESQTTLLSQELFSALKFLGRKGEIFDLIYIDPPYGMSVISVLLELEIEKLLAKDALVFLETSAKEPEFTYDSTRLQLRNTRCFGIARLTQFSHCNY